MAVMQTSTCLHAAARLPSIPGIEKRKLMGVVCINNLPVCLFVVQVQYYSTEDSNWVDAFTCTHLERYLNIYLFILLFV